MSAAVAMIPYANMAPYRQMAPPAGCHFVPMVPKASVNALLTGEVVAAAVPVGGLPRLKDIVEPLGRFGIAAKGPSMSVLLFSRCRFQDLDASTTLHLTDESASSVRLLYLLLGDICGFDNLPRMAGRRTAPDAELLIGDRALVKGEATRAVKGAVFVTDLSQLWYERYELPFVFARWVVRNDVTPDIRQALARWLAQFKAEEAMLVERAIPATAQRLDLPYVLIDRYFQVIRRCLDDGDMAGQQKFFQLFGQFGREPLFPSASNSSANEIE